MCVCVNKMYTLVNDLKVKDSFPCFPKYCPNFISHVYIIKQIISYVVIYKLDCLFFRSSSLHGQNENVLC